MQFLGFFIKFEKILNLLASAIGDFLIYANGQILKNNLATWSHGWHVMIFNNLIDGHPKIGNVDDLKEKLPLKTA